MSFKFGSRSMVKLSGVHRDMRALMLKAISESPIDFGITCGGRTVAEQTALYAQNKTKTMKSKHLPCLFDEDVKIPVSGAVDIVCIDPTTGKYSWDAALYHTVHQVVEKCANDLGIEIRWGGDWDRDGDTTDQTFNDLPHYELYSGMYNYDFSKVDGLS